MLEQTQKRRFLDLVFGLTPGWWRFDDTNVRPEYPLLTPEAWQAVFEAAALDAHFHPVGPAEDGLTLFLAQARTAGRFLLLGREGGDTAALVAQLTGMGAAAVTLAAPFGQASRLESALGSEPWRAVLLLDDSDAVRSGDVDKVRAALQQSISETLRVLQTMARLAKPPHRYLITRSGVAATEQDDPDPLRHPSGVLAGRQRRKCPVFSGAVDIDDDPNAVAALHGIVERPVAGT